MIYNKTYSKYRGWVLCVYWNVDANLKYVFFNSKYLKRNDITYYKCIHRMIFDNFNDKDDLNLMHLFHD